MTLIIQATHTYSLQVEHAGCNWLDAAFRSGSVLTLQPPKALGMEAAGTIVALPTAESVLSNKDYKARGFRVGGRVAIVSPPITFHLMTECDILTRRGNLGRRGCICRVHGRSMDEHGRDPRSVHA